MTKLSAPTSSSTASPTSLDNAPQKSGMRLPRWIVPGVVVIGGVFLLGSMLLPNLCKSSETANRVKCASNMKQIGIALKMFADEHQGRYPDQLSELIATEDLTPSVFICPSGTAEASTATSQAQLAADLLDPKHSSYIYIKQNAGMADLAVVIEFLKNHDQDGMTVLFGDGHAEFMQYRISSPETLWALGIPKELMKSKVEQ